MLKLSNKYFFWIIIIILMLTIIVVNQNINNKTDPKQNDIVERSYKVSEDTYVLDLNKIDNARSLNDIKTNDLKDQSFIFRLKTISNENLLLFLYTIIISILFIVREKQNKTKEMINQKKQDQLLIKIAKKNTNISIDLESDLSQYSNILSSDIDIKNIDDKIDKEGKYLIIASRVIVEKLLLELYTEHFDEEATLNTIIYKLQKAKLINTSILNYAHIIKAFGNKAVHPNIKNPVVFTKQEVLLVLTTLSQFLKEIDTNNILDIKND